MDLSDPNFWKAAFQAGFLFGATCLWLYCASGVYLNIRREHPRKVK